MPDLNGTGPHNRGPLTGRGYGKCILPLNTPEEELSFLENRRQALSQECILEAIWPSYKPTERSTR